MGLFAVALTRTTKDNAECAMANIKLFLDDNCNPRSDYLLDFAQGQLETVKILIKEAEKEE
jgi:hypothetical protein